MATVSYQDASGRRVDLPDDATLVVQFPGVPPRSIRVRDLATVMGTAEVWFEVERFLLDL